MKKFLKSLLKIIKKIKPSFSQLLIILLIFSACNRGEKISNGEQKKGKIIAEVKGKYLYESDISPLINRQLSKNDSIQMVKDFIDKWIREQLIFQKAINNLSDKEKNKDKELEEYYKNLIIYEYENKLIRQKLDTVVSEEEMEQFYENNRSQFVLKKCLLRGIFVKVGKQAPDIDKVRRWYQSTNADELDLLHQYCIGNAEIFNVDETKWYYYDELTSILPIRKYECETLRKGQTLELSDSLNYYFFAIYEVKPRGTFMPFSFARDLIENTILHQRKLNLLKKSRESIYEEGIRKKYFKIYEKN